MNLLHKLYYGSGKTDTKQQHATRKQLNTSIVLPGHIGSRILDLELEMEAKTMTKETAEELLSLYSVSHGSCRKRSNSMRRNKTQNTALTSNASNRC